MKPSIRFDTLCLTPDESTKFHSLIKVADACHIWSGPDNGFGYGRFNVARNGKTLMIKPHRLAWFLATGVEPGIKRVVQSCGNHLCVNPIHLELEDFHDIPRDPRVIKMPRHGYAPKVGAEALYVMWASMRRRTRHKKGYADRGISVCREWESYPVFRAWAMDNGYARGLEIDRRDNDGNYEPSNCRWVTRIVNANNTSKTVFVTAFGETKSLREWSDDERCQTSKTNIRSRIEDGWKPEDAISFPTLRQRYARRIAA